MKLWFWYFFQYFSGFLELPNVKKIPTSGQNISVDIASSKMRTICCQITFLSYTNYQNKIELISNRKAKGDAQILTYA